MKNMIEQRKEMRGQGGFTLIELLVVIAILGVLAGVVVFAVGGITDNSKASACKMDKRTVQTAVQAYRAENGNYPTDMNDLVPGFLDEASTMTDFSVAGNQVTYTQTCP